MAGARNVSVVMDETKKKNPKEPLRVVEKDIPSPGPGQALVRIFLRPVSSTSTDDEVRSIMTEVEISYDVFRIVQVNPSDVASGEEIITSMCQSSPDDIWVIMLILSMVLQPVACIRVSNLTPTRLHQVWKA